MHLGILISTMEKRSIKECITLAHQIGYTEIEVSACMGDLRPNIGDGSKEEAKNIIDFARKLKLNVSSLQCHFHFGYGLLDEDIIENPPSCSAKTRLGSIEHTKRIIDLANYLEVGIVHTVSGILPELDTCQHEKYTGSIDYPKRREWQSLLLSYVELLDYAKIKGVKLAIEPVFAYIVGSCATTRMFLKDLGRSDLYINYDPSHFPYHKESAASMIKEMGAKIIHVHVKDAAVLNNSSHHDIQWLWKMVDGRFFSFAPAGKGILNWDEIIGELKKCGYNGVLSVEMGHWGDEEQAEQNAKANFAFFNNLLKN